MKNVVSFFIVTIFLFLVFSDISGAPLTNTTGYKAYEVSFPSEDILSSGSAWKKIVSNDSSYLQTKYTAKSGWVYFYYYSKLTVNNTAFRDSNVVTVYVRVKNHQDSLLYTITCDTLIKSGGNFLLPFGRDGAGFYYDVYVKTTKVAATDILKINKFGVGRRRLVQ